MNTDVVAAIVEKAFDDLEFKGLLEKVPQGDSPYNEIRTFLQKEGFADLSADDVRSAMDDAIDIMAMYTDMRADELLKERERNRQLGQQLSAELVLGIQQIGKGFSRVMDMYTVAFYMGVALVSIGLIMSFVLRENLLALVTGIAGFGDVVGLMIYKPATELQNSRGNLAQLQAALFTWINDMSNWNAFLERLSNVTDESKPIPVEEMKKVSEVSLENLDSIMWLIQEYCELDLDKDKQKILHPPLSRRWPPVKSATGGSPSMPLASPT